MKNSKIEWTHHTFNPWWGCTKVSDACTHCYAEAFAKRTGHDIWGPNKPRRFFGEKHWTEPLSWDAAAKSADQRHRIFCASMADVFEDYFGPSADQLQEARSALWTLIERTPHLDWLLLTKRPENFLKMVPGRWVREFPGNVWAMTTVENQEQAEVRIPELLKIPARVRGLSMEPLLEQVDLSEWLWDQNLRIRGINQKPNYNVHWVIAGGESGPRSRPTDPDAFLALRDQCLESNVSFFFKQWGDWKDGKRLGKAKAGRLLENREWNEVPEQIFHALASDY